MQELNGVQGKLRGDGDPCPREAAGVGRKLAHPEAEIDEPCVEEDGVSKADVEVRKEFFEQDLDEEKGKEKSSPMDGRGGRIGWRR